MQTASPLAAAQQRFNVSSSIHPLYPLEQQALQILQRQGLPTAKDEAYRHTPITQVLSEKFDLSQPASQASIAPNNLQAPLCSVIDAYHFIFVNGRLDWENSQLLGSEQYLQLLSFQDAYTQYGREFVHHATQGWDTTSDAFTALNMLLREESTFVYIKPHAIVDKPLVFHYLVDARQQPTTVAPRCLVVAGENSEVNFIATWHTLGSLPSFTNACAHIVVEKAARFNHYTLQTQDSAQAYHVNHLTFRQARQSVLNTYTFTWSSAMVRNNLNVRLEGSYSEANLYGLCYPSGRQHTDNHTQVYHYSPHTRSNELYKSIVHEAATGVFNGKIYVKREAQKARAFQANHNIVLSGTAAVYTEPQLEIWADDVKCSHGATTGQLDQQALFYLRTRGISESTARHILLRAFTHEVIDRVPLPALSNYLLEGIDQLAI
ncbi:MAG: Fe-S cluster assembly protein SufD [Bacteroidota bacterium]